MLIDFFISPAFAETAPLGGSTLFSLLPLILLFAVFYFILIRPQQKKAKEQKNMIATLKVGDEVISHGGLLGRIVHADDNFLQVEITSNTVVTLQRNGITTLMPKGTYKPTKSEGGSFNNKNSARRRSGSRRNDYQPKSSVKSSAKNAWSTKEDAKANFDQGIKRRHSGETNTDILKSSNSK